MIDRLKHKWGITSTRRVWMILLVFALTGMGILLVKRPVFGFLGIPPGTTLWVQIPLALVLYQILLVAIGAALGEFAFFWEKEKRLWAWLTRPFKG